MKKSTSGSLPDRLTSFLFRYRITPHSTTGRTPAELLMGRVLRCPLDLLHPNTRSSVYKAQMHQKTHHDKHARPRAFADQDPVFVRNFGKTPTWIPGVVMEQTGPLSYIIKLGNNQLIRRHIDHIRARSCSSTSTTAINAFEDWPTTTTSDQAEPPPSPSSSLP